MDPALASPLTLALALALWALHGPLPRPLPLAFFPMALATVGWRRFKKDKRFHIACQPSLAPYIFMSMWY